MQIEACLAEPLSLADIAAASGLSAFHFSRLFTALHGESVMAYAFPASPDISITWPGSNWRPARRRPTIWTWSRFRPRPMRCGD